MEIKDSVREQLFKMEPHFANVPLEKVYGDEFFIEFEYLKHVCDCKSCRSFMSTHKLEWVMTCDELPE